MNKTEFQQTAPNKLQVKRMFNAPHERVWAAWTDSQLLDQWWAPKPFITITKSMNFSPGGMWHYAMEGPDETGQLMKHWCRLDYIEIDAKNSFTSRDTFCDEDANPTPVFPAGYWQVQFAADASGTQVTVDITYDTEEDLQKIVALGFKEGFSMAHDNLDEILSVQAA